MAASFLSAWLADDASALAPGQAQYSAMCLPDGGVLDDLLVYRLAEEAFLLVVNASNTGKMAAWTQGLPASCWASSVRAAVRSAPGRRSPIVNASW